MEHARPGPRRSRVYDPAAPQVRERHLLAVLVGEGEVGGFLADADHTAEI
jgi:hypothetical protein